MNHQEHVPDESDHRANDARHQSDPTASKGAAVKLDPRPERHLLRASGSSSYLDVVVKVAATPNRSQTERPAVHVALVIDRSGSMGGPKVITAKQAALAVLDGLGEQDTAAVVVFDDRVDVVQVETPVTALVKTHVAAELAGIDARGSTALHEGWLVGCQAIAADSDEQEEGARTVGVRRCFLLTDGLANVGLSQPDAVAQAAAQVREAAHVGTSTFGIGTDYNEELLGPMALSGGGEFYHLRTPQEIATTFVRELEQLLGVLARDAHLEIEATPGTEVALVSAYPWRAGAPTTAGAGRWSVTVGDLLGGEERHVVLSLDFPAVGTTPGDQSVQVRLTWSDAAGTHATDWQRCTFRYAESETAYEDEIRDETVLHFAAQHLSDRAQREAISARKRGDLESARAAARSAISGLAGLGLREGDQVWEHEVQSLEVMNTELAAPRPDSATLKERYYQSQTRSRSKLDLRGRGQADHPSATPPKDTSTEGGPMGETPPSAGS
jgi:Ca-activated chloride channel family protein